MAVAKRMTVSAVFLCVSDLMTTEDSEKIVGFIKKCLDELLTEFRTPPKQHVTETEGAFELSS